jgi:hypothetical protein
MASGAADGPGIYMAAEAATSWRYARIGMNQYAGSGLGQQLQILSLVEVARVPELKNHAWGCTLTREEACVVRFLFIANGITFQFNVAQNPPQNVPNLATILEFHAKGV